MRLMMDSVDEMKFHKEELKLMPDSKKIDDVVGRIGNAPVAIYGTGNGAKDLISTFNNKANVNIIGLIDSEEAKIGTEICGYHVYSLEQVLDKVKFIVISSKSYQEIIYNRICWVKNLGISILTIYPTPFDFIEPDHFRTNLSIQESQQLFKNSINMVEIEVFSYCNRRCWFCPNSIIDRISDNKYMDEKLYLSVLEQLREIDYSAKVSFSRYNEPLADRIILDRLIQASRYLPKSILHFNTNADYLNKEYLKELYAVGLRSLNIQIYLGNEERFNYHKILEKKRMIVDRLGLAEIPIKNDPLEWIESKLIYEDMNIRIYGRNFDQNGCNRGGTVDIKNDYVRTSPCLSPFWHIYIDYNRKMMPCCNLRSDYEKHQQAIVWDLSIENNIFKAYTSKELVDWRKRLISFDEKDGLCRSCAFSLLDRDEMSSNRKFL